MLFPGFGRELRHRIGRLRYRGFLEVSARVKASAQSRLFASLPHRLNLLSRNIRNQQFDGISADINHSTANGFHCPSTKQIGPMEPSANPTRMSLKNPDTSGGLVFGLQ